MLTITIVLLTTIFFNSKFVQHTFQMSAIMVYLYCFSLRCQVVNHPEIKYQETVAHVGNLLLRCVPNWLGFSRHFTGPFVKMGH